MNHICLIHGTPMRQSVSWYGTKYECAPCLTAFITPNGGYRRDEIPASTTTPEASPKPGFTWETGGSANNHNRIYNLPPTSTEDT